MKKLNFTISIITLCLVFLCTFCTAFAKEIKGNGKLITKTITISDFTKIDVENQIAINYSQGKSTGQLEFTIDENLWEYYDIYTKDGVLFIGLKKANKKQKTNPIPTKSMITVSSEELNKIETSGSVEFVFCTPFTSNELKIETAGHGKVIANKYPIQITECDIEITGSGSVFLAGTIKKAAIDIAGQGNLQALDCEIAQLSIEIAGSGKANVYVTDELDVEIAGSGDVRFKGSPKVSADIVGSGSVKKF